jgi:hypothetical protein
MMLGDLTLQMVSKGLTKPNGRTTAFFYDHGFADQDTSPVNFLAFEDHFRSDIIQLCY